MESAVRGRDILLVDDILESGRTLAFAPVPPVLLRGVGFRSPKSAVFDPVGDVYLVSNVNGGPADADNDGDS